MTLSFEQQQPIPRDPPVEPTPTRDTPPVPIPAAQFQPLASVMSIGSELFGHWAAAGGPTTTASTTDDYEHDHDHDAEQHPFLARTVGLTQRDAQPDGTPLPQAIDWRWRPPHLGVRNARVGWILAPALAALLTDPDLQLRITRADALTGITVARDPRTYRPNAALAGRIRDRDRTCRFPGCGIAARRCDIDHVIRFPDGITTEDNLLCLCRTHHGFKHHARWTLALDPNGTCHWTAPNGRTHTTYPADLRLDAA